MKVGDEWHKAVYLASFYKAKQNISDVLAITEVVAEQFHKDYPHIKSLYVKSDNAGCYHTAPTVEVVRNIFKKFHIKIERYDFNEPKKGKDSCDREAAYIKRRYNEQLNRDKNKKN